MKVFEAEGKQELLVLSNNQLQSYTLPDLLPTNIHIEYMQGNAYFDIYNKQIIAGSDDEVHLWNLKTNTATKLEINYEEDYHLGALVKF